MRVLDWYDELASVYQLFEKWRRHAGRGSRNNNAVVRSRFRPTERAVTTMHMHIEAVEIPEESSRPAPPIGGSARRYGLPGQGKPTRRLDSLSPFQPQARGPCRINAARMSSAQQCMVGRWFDRSRSAEGSHRRLRNARPQEQTSGVELYRTRRGVAGRAVLAAGSVPGPFDDVRAQTNPRAATILPTSRVHSSVPDSVSPRRSAEGKSDDRLCPSGSGADP